MSRKPTERFKKKNFLSQTQLGTFLTWRGKKIKNEVFRSSNLDAKKNGPPSNFNFRKKKSGFFKTLYLPVQPLRLMKFDRTRFFPEKTPFIQFWVFPFLGACFLSFQTFQKPDDPTKLSNAFPFKETQNARQTARKTNSNSAVSTNQKRFFGTYSESKNRTSLFALNTKQLCDFYLTLTEQKLSSSFEFYESLQKESTLSFSKTAFFACQFRQNQFLQPSHSLCFENSNRFRSENLTQKLKLAYFYNDRFNRSVFDTLKNKKDSESFLTASPIRSYYEASMFFDKLVTQLHFYKLLTNKKTKPLKIEQTAVEYFGNLSKCFEKDIIITSFERLHTLENHLQKLQKASTISAKSFSNLFQTVKNNSMALKLFYVQKNDFLKHVFKNFPESFERNQSCIDNFHSIYKYHLLKIWLKKQVLKQKSSSDVSHTDNLRTQKNKTKSFLLKNMASRQNFYRANKFTSIANLQSKENWKRILNATRFLRETESRNIVETGVLKNLKKLEALERKTPSTVLKKESTDFSVILLTNHLEKIINDLIILNTWGKMALERNDSKIALTLSDRCTHLLSKDIDRSRKTSKTNKLKNTKFIHELRLYRKLFQISSKLMSFDSKKQTLEKTHFETQSNRFDILRYKTPIVKSSITTVQEEEMPVDTKVESDFVSKNDLSNLSINSRM
jgi:hypothetical protein